MRAIYIDEPGKVSFRDIPAPVRKPGEALLKVLYGGICGSDLGSFYYLRKLTGKAARIKEKRRPVTAE